MNSKKGLFCASFLGLLCLSAVSLSSFYTRSSVARAEDGVVQKNALNYDDSSFAGEVDVDARKLTVTVANATKTTTGESLVLNFSTGGTGFQSRSLTYTVSPFDDEFADYYAEFDAMTSEEKKQIQQEYKEGRYETKVFGGEIYSLTNRGADYKNIVIPKNLYRDVFFYFEIQSIHENCILADELNPATGSKIESITIPNTVTTIHSSSFPSELPEGFVFNVEFQESQVPSTWAADWNHGATVNYGVSFPSASRREAITSITPYGDKNANFIIGYYPETGTQYPLVISYKLKGEATLRYFALSKSTTSSLGSYYDAVGYQLYETSNSLYADIPLDLSNGGEIDPDSIVVHNILVATRDSGSWQPDLTQIYKATPTVGYKSVLNIDDLLTFEFTGLSTFSGYTSVNMVFNHASVEAYARLKPSFYRQYKERIESGVVKVRYRFASLSNCAFEIVYNNGSEDVSTVIPVRTPVNNYTLENEKGNIVSFLLKNSDVGSGFNFKSIRKLSFVGFFVNVELYLTDKGVVSRSGIVSRFAHVELMKYNTNPQTFDINVFIIILVSSYVVLFLIGSFVMFFVMKEKYKNDEFKRVKPKVFWKRAIIALVGGLLVLLAITFIIIRCVAMNNAIVVYNPVDAYIIIFSIAAVITIGYFIKYLVVTIKANKARKEAIKLKLNEDVADDGTN